MTRAAGRALVSAMLVAAGCGRVGFDPLAAGELGPGGACTADVQCSGCGTCDGTCQPFDFQRLALGHVSAIGVASDGTYWGWGTNDGNSLDLPTTTTDIGVPIELSAIEPYSSVMIGAYMGAGYAPDGTIWDWGEGDGVEVNQVSADADWHDLQVAWAWGCAQHSDHTLWCWGDNYRGNLGDGTNTDRDTPIQIQIPAIASYGIDEYLGCAIDMSGALWCWGDNSDAEAAVATPGVTETPPAQVGTDTDWTELAVGGDMACARHASGTVDCWGDGYINGQVDTTPTPTPIDARTDWTAIRAHYDHTCALAGDGSVWCWGDNTEGEIGQGDVAEHVSPTQVTLPGPADDLELGGHTSCARVAGTYWCWGRNDGGELGIGSVGANVLSPFARCPS